MRETLRHETRYASGRGHLEPIRAILDNRHRLDKEPQLAQALLRACLVGDLAGVIALLYKGASVNSTDENGRAPLMEAAFGGHLAVIAELLAAGAAVNAQDHDGWTALMEAAAKGHYETVRLLLTHGADISIRNRQGQTVLTTTARGHKQLINLLKRFRTQ